MSYAEDFAAGVDPVGWTWESEQDASVCRHEFFSTGIPAEVGVSTAVRLIQDSPAPSDANPDFISGVVLTSDRNAVWSFWANFADPNNAHMTASIQLVREDGLSFIAGVDFYGDQYSTKSYYTQPGWQFYQRTVLPGSYRVRIQGTTAYDTEFHGAMTMEVTKIRIDPEGGTPPIDPPPPAIDPGLTAEWKDVGQRFD